MRVSTLILLHHILNDNVMMQTARRIGNYTTYICTYQIEFDNQYWPIMNYVVMSVIILHTYVRIMAYNSIIIKS